MISAASHSKEATGCINRMSLFALTLDTDHAGLSRPVLHEVFVSDSGIASLHLLGREARKADLIELPERSCLTATSGCAGARLGVAGNR